MCMQGPAQVSLAGHFCGKRDFSTFLSDEFFGNSMVVNGNRWPFLNVESRRYRFRLLNGCDSRFLNLSLVVVASPDAALVGMEIPFFQIGAEQGLLGIAFHPDFATDRRVYLHWSDPERDTRFSMGPIDVLDHSRGLLRDPGA